MRFIYSYEMRLLFIFLFPTILIVSCKNENRLDPSGKTVDFKKETSLPFGYNLGMTPEEFERHSNSIGVDTTMLNEIIEEMRQNDSLASVNNWLLKPPPIYVPLKGQFVYCAESKSQDSVPLGRGCRGVYYFFDKSDGKTIPIALYPEFKNEYLIQCLYQIHGCKKEIFSKYLLNKYSDSQFRKVSNTGNRPSLKGREGIVYSATEKLNDFLYNIYELKNN